MREGDTLSAEATLAVMASVCRKRSPNLMNSSLSTGISRNIVSTAGSSPLNPAAPCTGSARSVRVGLNLSKSLKVRNNVGIPSEGLGAGKSLRGPAEQEQKESFKWLLLALCPGSQASNEASMASLTQCCTD